MTPGMNGELRFGSRFVDRAAAEAPARGPWRHPQAAPAVAPPPGEHFVDGAFFDDRTEDVTEMPLRRGSRVKHPRFGEGKVVQILSVGEPAVVAFFPGWGERKILARFLRPAG